ncbi:MAG: cellulase family glycosylhydrolase [Planctomycetota bacterium]|nr:cellulase family glycosylhydrolase [Planctomycetota bacterium]
MRRTLGGAVLVLCCVPLGAVEITLRAPATTVVSWDIPETARACTLTVEVPEEAPADLSAIAAIAERDGGWGQLSLARAVSPGTHRWTLSLSPEAFVAGSPPLSCLTPPSRLHLTFASVQASQARLRCTASWLEQEASPPAPARERLRAIWPGPSQLAVGERYEVEVESDPPLRGWGEDPQLTLRIAEPDGSQRTVQGFVRVPMSFTDLGDREAAAPLAAARLVCRFRPRQPGRHQLQLHARWANGSEAQVALPDVVAAGAASTNLVRIDPSDGRFLQIDGRWWWPIGLNLHNPYDLRSAERLGTRLTPPRGLFVYAALFDRLAAAGIDAVEIWMSSWNLGLLWHPDWPGYHGLRALNQIHAERLDRILDAAWQRGIRVLLVLHNHGQASDRTDREWRWNPLNAAHGGPCQQPGEVFTHPAARALQSRLRRYLVARYADHPALWGWKLWSEIDLTAGTAESLAQWHAEAAAELRALDPSGRPITTHWSGDYRRVHASVAALPGIELLTIDAYRGSGPGSWGPLELLGGVLQDPARGLQRWRKPVLVTEFGGTSSGQPAAAREVDFRLGGWIALVSGHAGAPLYWWWEWVDQGDHWQPYRALRAFVAGEDLRDPRAQSQALDAAAPGHRLWARAWLSAGRLLGYVVAETWARDGGTPPLVTAGRIRLPEGLRCGSATLSWWDPDRGTALATLTRSDPAALSELHPPDFHGHLAWKLQLAP